MKNYDVDSLVDGLDLENNFMHNRGNDIFLSNNQIALLESYNFDYKKYDSLESLIMGLEYAEFDDDEIDEIISTLSEINYYKNTKK